MSQLFAEWWNHAEILDYTVKSFAHQWPLSGEDRLNVDKGTKINIYIYLFITHTYYRPLLYHCIVDLLATLDLDVTLYYVEVCFAIKSIFLQGPPGLLWTYVEFIMFTIATIFFFFFYACFRVCKETFQNRIKFRSFTWLLTNRDTHVKKRYELSEHRCTRRRWGYTSSCRHIKWQVRK